MSQQTFRLRPLDQLQQRAAEGPVEDLEPIAILGGPGTGKSQTLLARVVHLLTQGVDPRNITYLAFSSRMAQNFRRRLLDLAPEYSAPVQDLFVGTLEQYALNFLRYEGPKLLGISASFRVWDREQVAEVIAEVWGRGQDEERLDAETVERIIRWLEQNRSRTRIQERVRPPHPSCPQILRRYEGEKERCHAVDVPDLVPLAIKAMESAPAVGRIWATYRSKHLLVDGLQDAKPVHRALLDLLAGPDGSVAVTSDPDQGISDQFGGDPGRPWPPRAGDWKNAHQLVINHRIVKPLLDAAKLLAPTPVLPDITADQQRPVLTTGSPPVIWRCLEEEQTDALLLDEVSGLHGTRTVDFRPPLTWDDLAIICRDPADAERIRQLLATVRIPTTAWGASRPFDEEVRRVIQLLSSSLNPRDIHSFSWPPSQGKTGPGPLSGI